MLLFGREGVEYMKDGNSNPILPIFRIADNKAVPAATGPQFDPDGPAWSAVNRACPENFVRICREIQM